MRYYLFIIIFYKRFDSLPIAIYLFTFLQILIFSVTGGVGLETQVFIKILCDKITRKTDQSYPCC